VAIVDGVWDAPGYNQSVKAPFVTAPASRRGFFLPWAHFHLPHPLVLLPSRVVSGMRSPAKRSNYPNRHNTSVTLEDAFWHSLQDRSYP
jgi:hypothetical protein